jgi:hypothetical protein
MATRSLHDKPFSLACEENQAPILAVIGPLFAKARRIVEIGSGNGQHAVYCAAWLPHPIWQTSDVPAQQPGIRLWVAQAQLPNLPEPLSLDVTGDWPAGPFDGVFSANTAHIMGAPEVALMFLGVGRLLAPGGSFALYGPFSDGGRHSSESNARFDASLKARDPRMGVRDLDDLLAMADRAGMELRADRPMPVNNRTLVWCRRNAAGSRTNPPTGPSSRGLSNAARLDAFGHGPTDGIAPVAAAGRFVPGGRLWLSASVRQPVTAGQFQAGCGRVSRG